VFVARYNFSGNPEWVKSDGSNSPVSAGALDLDNLGNVYMAGLFRCVFNEYADQYGQGVFNSVGFNDVFVSKYDSIGNRLWSRQAGGPAEDEVNGIAVNDVDTPVVSGSFNKRFVCPAGLVFQNYGPFPGFLQPATAPFFLNCGDNRYGNFVQGISAGGRDIFFGKVIDISRLPYDFYKRTVSTCNPGQVSGCVSTIAVDNNCQDQLTPSCGGITLTAVSNTSSSSAAVSNYSPGPDFTYLWNTGAVTRSYLVNASGTYTVTMTSADGCFSSTDSMSVVINTIPSTPIISDSKNYNVNVSQTIPIDLCAPDSVILSANNVVPGVTVTWTYNSVVTQNDSLAIYATNALVSGAVVRYTTAAGCTSQNVVLIRIESGTLDTIKPYLQVNDSVSSCSSPVAIRVADSLTVQPCSIQDLVGVTWNITPFALAIPQSCPFNQYVTIAPAVTGNYTVQATIVRYKCGILDTIILSKTIFVQAGLPPTVNGSVTGAPITELCPGSSLQFTASGGTSYQWSNGSSNPTITVTQGSMNYCVTISVDSNGCIGTQQICRQVDDPVAPVIVSSITPSIICPGDSVLLSVTSPGVSFDWFGPGIASAVNDTLYGLQPGIYYCNVTNSNGCTLISNLLELVQYSTPYIFVSPSTVFCNGDTVTLSVQSAGNAFPLWDFPLSGNALTQSVQQPGTYTCSISSCGITTVDSVTLTAIQVIAFIPQADTAICYGDSLVLTPLPFTGTALWFPDSSVNNTLTVTAGNSYYMQITDPNGCTAYSNIVIVDVDTIRPPASILSTTPLCEGSQLNISPVLIPGENAVWTGPNSFSSSLQDVLIDSVTSANGGYYVVTVNNGQCFSDPDSVFIQIYDSVPNYQLIASPFCENDTVVINALPVPGYTFTWTDPFGAVTTDTAIQLLNYAAAQSGYYILSVLNGICPAFLDSIYLGIPANSSISINSTDPSACEGDTVLVTALSSPGNLNWFPSGSSQSLAITASTPVYCILTDTAGCVFYSDTIGVAFNQPPVISGMNDLIACEGDPVILNATVSNGTIQQVNYSWFGPSGSFSNQLNPTLSNVQAADAGMYTLLVADSVCTGIRDTLTLQVNVAPSLPVLTANLPECPGDELLLVALASSGSSAGFIDPSGQTILSDSLYILNTSNADTGMYYYFAATPACPTVTGSVKVNFDSCRVADAEWVIPNIFSPNEDGINDVFVPKKPPGEDGTLRIYNRWGDFLFEGNISEGWNGRDEDGNYQPSGVYYWIMIPISMVSTLKEKNGFLELVK
jgi:gliding motility-associated-like protein